MRIEADVHLLELPRLRIEVLHLPEAALLRRQRRRRMRPAERRLVLGPAEPRRHPHASLAVHRRVIRDRGIEPVQLVAPVRRRHRHRSAPCPAAPSDRAPGSASPAPYAPADRRSGIRRCPSRRRRSARRRWRSGCACRSSARRARTSPDRPSPTSSARDCARRPADAAAPAARRRATIRSVQLANISRPRRRPRAGHHVAHALAVLPDLDACVPCRRRSTRTSRAPSGSRASPGCPSDDRRCSWP